MVGVSVRQKTFPSRKNFHTLADLGGVKMALPHRRKDNALEIIQMPSPLLSCILIWENGRANFARQRTTRQGNPQMSTLRDAPSA
jgi:hypothetical protein